MGAKIISKIHDSLTALWSKRIKVGDIVIDAKPAEKTKIQHVGILLETKTKTKMGINLKLGRVYWFGQVKNLNTEDEKVIALDEDHKAWVSLSGLQVLKRAVEE